MLNDYINNVENITKKIVENIEADNDIRLVGYYYWDYSDFINWVGGYIETKNKSTTNSKQEEFISKKAHQLILMAQKAHEAQSKLLNKVFAESVSARKTTLK